MGGGVDDALRTITLEKPVSSNTLFPVDAQGRPDAKRHTRIRRWDQAGQVLRTDTAQPTNYFDLDSAASTGAIPVPGSGNTAIALENGIVVKFSVDPAGGTFRAGDYWVFAARAADASVELLAKAPPRGIHHHYAKLGLLTLPTTLTDCRIFWPPGTGCCTFVVRPGESIQAAIDALPSAGGCVCLKTGVHPITETIKITRPGVVLHGESPGVQVTATGLVAMLQVGGGARPAHDVEIAMIDFELAGATSSRIVVLVDCARVSVRRCALRYIGQALTSVLGFGIYNVQDVDVESNVIEGCYIGIRTDGAVRGLVVAQNVWRGQTTQGAQGPFPVSPIGIEIPSNSSVRCLENDFEDFLTAVRLNPGIEDAVVAGNRIRRRALPEAMDTAQPPDRMPFAIEVSADGCRIEGNRIDLAGQAYGGIRVAGRHNEVVGNRIASTSPRLTPVTQDGPAGPIGVLAGALTLTDLGQGDFTNLAGNHFTGLQYAVEALHARGMRIAGNTIVGEDREGVGIRAEACTETLIAENQVRDVAAPLWFGKGERNRVTENVLVTSVAGALIGDERSLEVSGNVIEDTTSVGIFALNLVGGSVRVVHNRVAHCGYAPFANSSVVAAVLIVQGVTDFDVTIESCEIVNTGVSPDLKQTATTPAIGIGVVAVGYVAACEIAGNRIVYQGNNDLDPNLEHWALSILGGGLFETVRFGNQIVEVALGGGGALITGNVFQGPGLKHLVELQRVPVMPVPSGEIDLRFERVTFANNRCDHKTEPADGVSTVKLFGAHLIVTGNHVKAARDVHAMDLGGRPKVALVANCTTGDYIGLAPMPNSPVPDPLALFNVQI